MRREDDEADDHRDQPVALDGDVAEHQRAAERGRQRQRGDLQTGPEHRDDELLGDNQAPTVTRICFRCWP